MVFRLRKASCVAIGVLWYIACSLVNFLSLKRTTWYLQHSSLMPFATLNSARRRKSTVKTWNRKSRMICLTIVTQIHIVPFKGHYCLRAVKVKEAKVHIWVTEDGNVHNKEDAREGFSLRQNKQALPSGPGVFTYLVFDESQRGILCNSIWRLRLKIKQYNMWIYRQAQRMTPLLSRSKRKTGTSNSIHVAYFARSTRHSHIDSRFAWIWIVLDRWYHFHGSFVVRAQISGDRWNTTRPRSLCKKVIEESLRKSPTLISLLHWLRQNARRVSSWTKEKLEPERSPRWRGLGQVWTSSRMRILLFCNWLYFFQITTHSSRISTHCLSQHFNIIRLSS